MDVNENIIQAQATELEDTVMALYDKFLQEMVEDYYFQLDEKVMAIKTYLDRCRQMNIDMDMVSLQRIVVDLSTTIYFVSDKVERLGAMDDLSNLAFKDKYNRHLIELQSAATVENRKYTVDQLRSLAESNTTEERLLNLIYAHAARVLKGKVDSANEVLRSCSKCLSASIQNTQTFGQDKFTNLS